MIDRFRLWAKGGDGGNGCTSFRRSQHDRHGKPDGGFYKLFSCDQRVLNVILQRYYAFYSTFYECVLFILFKMFVTITNTYSFLLK